MYPLQISEEPIAYSIACGEDLEIIRYKLLNHISISESYAFNFSGQVYTDNKRQIYELGTFCYENAELLDNIKNTFRKIFQTSFAAFRSTYKLERTNQKKIVIFVRCRLVKDSPGYFLGPHNDSTDTLFAFLLAIKKAQQPTSAFRKIRMQSLAKAEFLNKSDAITFVADKYGCDYMTEIANQFTRATPMMMSYCKKRKLLITAIDDVDSFKISVWRCRDLTAQTDEVLAIPNSSNRMFQSNLLGPAKALGTHGVLPTAEERINLLADVLCIELDENQGVTGFKNNKNEIMFSLY